MPLMDTCELQRLLDRRNWPASSRTGGSQALALIGISPLVSSMFKFGDSSAVEVGDRRTTNSQRTNDRPRELHSGSLNSIQNLAKRPSTDSRKKQSLIYLLSLYPIQTELISHLTTSEFLSLSQSNSVIRTLLSAPILPLKEIYAAADVPVRLEISPEIHALMGYNVFASTRPYKNNLAKRDLYHGIKPLLPLSSSFQNLFKRTKRGCSCAVMPSQSHSCPSVRSALGTFPVEMACSQCEASICFLCWWVRVCTAHKDDEGYGTTELMCRGCVAPTSTINDLGHCECGVLIVCHACNANFQTRNESHGAHFLDGDGGLRRDLAGWLDPDRAWLATRKCRGCGKPRIDDDFDCRLRILKDEGKKKIYQDTNNVLHMASDYLTG